MTSKKKTSKICDNFFGIKWDENIDNGLRIFSKMKHVTFTNKTEEGNEVGFYFTGGRYFGERVSIWALSFMLNQFFEGFIAIEKKPKDSAIVTFDKVYKKLKNIYGEPAAINDKDITWSFKIPDRPIGSWINLGIEQTNIVSITYSSGDFGLSIEEISANAAKCGCKVEILKSVEGE